jgi:predicted transcriptional regulator
MPRKAINRLGELERAVMEQVWAAAEQGRPTVSVREVHDGLSGRRDIAYTTVMTVMGRLTESGLLTQERSGRAYRYAAAGSLEELTAATMHEQLRGMEGEDRRTALLHFLDGATDDDLEDLRVALAALEARQPDASGSSGGSGGAT